MDIPIRADEPPFQPLLHEIQIAGGRRDEVVILGQPGDRAIVQHDAGFIAQHGIAHTAGLQIRKSVGVHLVEQGAGVAALHVKFAQRADVDDPHALAHGAILLVRHTPARTPEAPL